MAAKTGPRTDVCCGPNLDGTCFNSLEIYSFMLTTLFVVLYKTSLDYLSNVTFKIKCIACVYAIPHWLQNKNGNISNKGNDRKVALYTICDHASCAVYRSV